MRPDAVLVNTARGAVVDQDALAEAAAAGGVRAVLDVTDPEVLPPGHPLWDSDNVLITPHLAARRQRVGAPRRPRHHRGCALGSGLGFAHPVRRERLAHLA